MEVKRFTDFERKLTDQLLSLAMPRSDEEIHVSELVGCVKRSYYMRTEYKGEQYRSMAYKYVGKLLHRAFESLWPSAIVERQIERDGIVGTVDILGDYIFELKTTRKNPKRMKSIPLDWQYQVMAYCYLAGRRKAVLLVLNLITGELSAWLLEFSRDELEATWRMLRHRRNLLVDAIRTRTPDALPEYHEYCATCEFYSMCRGERRNQSSLFSFL